MPTIQSLVEWRSARTPLNLNPNEAAWNIFQFTFSFCSHFVVKRVRNGWACWSTNFPRLAVFSVGILLSKKADHSHSRYYALYYSGVKKH